MPAEEDADMLAFQEWKKKWYKNYATPDEEKTGFENFKENLRAERVYSPLPPSGLTLWEVFDEKADRPFKEHFGYIRLDHILLDDNDESDDDDTYLILIPVNQKDGTTQSQKFVIERRQRDEKQDTATVKHVPPVKRTSDDTEEEDTLKRQKIGCGCQNTRML